MLALVILLLNAQAPLAATEIEVLVKYEYSENRTHLYEKDGHWLCDTELQKKVEIKGKPNSPILFPKKEKKPNTECVGQFSGIKITDGKKTKWLGCADDPEVKPFLKSINRECAR